ncbi:MAG TPA: DsbA family protein [Rhizobiales bacterium]|nr:DsbA family protein [Hyphomicrobiales bacterium]
MAGDIFRGEGDLVIGNPNGDVTMVEFFDYNCGYCKRSLPDVMKMIKNDKNVKVVMKEFPILGEGSNFAARAAIASREQGKYWEFHLALLKKRGAVNEASVMKTAKLMGLDVEKLRKDMKAPVVDQIIKRNYAIAQQLNINGTPAFIIAENIFPGAVGFDVLSNAVAKVRKDGCTVC